MLGTEAGAAADRTGIAAGVSGRVDGGVGATGPEPGASAVAGSGPRPVSGRVPGARRSPSSGASPPSRAVGGRAGSGVPIPPRTRARAPPEGAGPVAGAR